MNLKFRRQYGIGRYIVDFYCPALQLAIEIDGPTHYTDKKVQLADNTRQKHLEEHGIHILRFTNQQVYQHIDTVMNQIVKAVEGLRPQQKIQSQSIPQLKKKIEKISIPA
jgi:very-short-patch-repair endonuclease